MSMEIEQANPYAQWHTALGGDPGELGIAPFVYGAVAASGAIATYLADDWDVAEYNAAILYVDEQIKLLDMAAKESGCWERKPHLKRGFDSFKRRWKAHYTEKGKIRSWSYVSDGEEMPVRNMFMPELDNWGKRLEKECQIQVAPQPRPNGGGEIFKPAPDPSGGGGGAGRDTQKDCGMIDRLMGKCKGEPSSFDKAMGAVPWVVGGLALFVGYKVYKDIKNG